MNKCFKKNSIEKNSLEKEFKRFPSSPDILNSKKIITTTENSGGIFKDTRKGKSAFGLIPLCCTTTTK